MKLDPDLVRAILIAVEDTPANHPATDPEIPGYSEDEVSEHVEVLIEHGYLDGKVAKSGMGGRRIIAVWINRLTMEGHEFLAASRNETFWKRAKAKVVSSGSAMTLSVLKSLLTEMSKKALSGDLT